MSEWRRALEVDTQLVTLADMEGNPYGDLISRYDYLEAHCLASNAARQ